MKSLESSKRRLMSYLESDQAQKDINKWLAEEKDKKRRLFKRFRRFTFYLKKHSFDEVMSRLIKEHDDAYIDKCYKKGYEPIPNQKLQFVMDYAEKYGQIQTHVKGITGTDYNEKCWQFRDYYFLNIYGQGVVIRLYKKKKLLLQL